MNGYWKCDFENKKGEVITKMIYAKTSSGASRHSLEMGLRIGMTPKYETLRGATKEEIREFKKKIKSKISV